MASKAFIKAAAALGAILVLTGCTDGYSEPGNDLSSFSLSSDGSIEAALLDDFSQAYYNESELTDYINKELTAYNAANGAESISLTGSERLGNNICVYLHFASVKDYDAYMPYSLFTGTVQEAYDNGYDLDCALAYPQQPEHVIGKNDLMNMADKKIMIFTGHGRIRMPSAVKFYTQSMKQTDAKTVEASEDGTYIIIY